MHPVLKLHKEGYDREMVRRGLHALNELGGGVTLSQAIGAEECNVYWVKPRDGEWGGFICNLVGGLKCRVTLMSDGYYEIRVRMPYSQRVCVLDKIHPQNLARDFGVMWSTVADVV